MTNHTGLALSPIKRRLGAGFIDLCLLVVLFIIFTLFFGTETAVHTAKGYTYQLNLTGLPFVAYLLSIFCYFLLFEWRVGATPGKLTFRIRVATYDGQQIGFKQAFVRNILRLVDGLPYVVPYALGVIFLLTNANRQRIGDIGAKTLVVQSALATQSLPHEHTAKN